MPSLKSISTKPNNLKINGKNHTTSLNIVLFLFSVALNGSILYYLNNLEDVSCKCIRDWRHNFIKAMSILSIIISTLPIFNVNIMGIPYVVILFGILGLVNIYSIYTYVTDLNATPSCSCAVVNQPKLNSFMKGYAYFIYGVCIFWAIVLMFSILVYMKTKLF